MTWLLIITVVLIPVGFLVGRASQRSKDDSGESLPLVPATSPIEVPAEVLDRIGEGVVVLNEVGTPVQANRAALEILGLAANHVPARLPLHELDPMLRRALAEAETVDEIIELGTPERKVLSVHVAPLDDERGAVLVLRDITEEARTLQIRRQFVAHASHELKSPIASIQTLAEAIDQASKDEPETAQRFATQLRQEAERLGRLVKSLLDLSKVEDPTTISSRSVDLTEIVRAQVTEFRPAAAAKSIALQEQIDNGIRVKGDGHQLGLLVRNLLDNALRYTESGGSITVTVTTHGNESAIAIADDGAGIPMRDQARVFERFYRVDEARSRASGGTGLGLAIVKHVADVHGGLVSLESELGEGSTFRVTLPLEPLGED